MYGGKIVNIAGMKIEGINTDTSKILPEVVELLKKCSPNVCVAGGAVLAAVTQNTWGKTFSDIDFWLTVKNPEESLVDVNTIISTTHPSTHSWLEHVFYGRGNVFYKQSYDEAPLINIINFKKDNLEEILSNFDNPASQVGVRVVEGEVQLLCSEDFIDTVKTGVINWWNFTSGSPARLVKYYYKGFKLAPHLEEIRELKENFLSESHLTFLPDGNSGDFVKNCGTDVRYQSYLPTYCTEELYTNPGSYVDLHIAESVSTCGNTLLVSFDAPIAKMLDLFFQKSLLPKMKADCTNGRPPTWEKHADQFVLIRQERPSRIMLPKLQKHVVLDPDTIIVISNFSSIKYKDLKNVSRFRFEDYKVRVFGRLEYHIVGDAYEVYIKPTFIVLL